MNGLRFWRGVLIGAQLAILTGLSSIASAAEQFDDIVISPQPLISGETHHGYREFRVLIQNRSSRETHDVLLLYPQASYTSGNSIRRISRTVSVGPGSVAVVPLWQPPLPAMGNNTMEIWVDGDLAGNVSLVSPHMTRTTARYGGPNPPATILVSRNLNYDDVDKKIRPTGRSNAFSAAMATGAPDGVTTSSTMHPNAWAPDGSISGPHWLEVEYATPIVANELRLRGMARSFSGGTATLKGVSGTNLATIAIPFSSSPTRRPEPFPVLSFNLTAEPVKSVMLNFPSAPRASLSVDAVELAGPSGSAWASVARASSEMPHSSSSTAPPGVLDQRELLRPEWPVSEWSGYWLSYTPFDAIILAATDLRTAPPEVQSALWRYAECGGNLVLMGGEVPEPWRSFRGADVEGGKSFNTGFGRCFLFDTDNVSDLKSPAVAAVIDAANKTARFWQSLPDGNTANAGFSVVENIRIPVRGTVLVMLVFVILIGPVNLIVLTRLNRRTWMLWTIPAVSLVTCLLVFMYSLFREGITPDARIEGLTLLDQSNRRAASWGIAAFYCPLTPSQGLLFTSETEATPLVEVGDHFTMPFATRGGTPREMDWTRSQHLQRGWITARVPAHFQLRKSESRRERLQVDFNGGQKSVVNGLGAPIRALWVADAAGRIYTAGGVPAGQTASLSPAADANVTSQLGFSGLISKVPGGSPVANYSTNAHTFLLPNTYIAELETNPFLENGLGPKAKSSRTRSQCVVYGLLEKPGP